MIIQSKTQRLIVLAGALIVFSILVGIGGCLLRGMTYDFERGLVVIPKRNGASYGLGVCYRNGQPTVCYTSWRTDGSISLTGFGRFRNWQSMWKSSDLEAALYGEETEFYETGARKTFGTCQVKDGKTLAEIWAWHPNGVLSTHFASRDFKINGPMRAWYSSGQLKFAVPMKAGEREGRVRWFDQSGNLIAQCECRNNEMIEGDFITWYGDTGYDGDILFDREDGRDYVIKTKASYRDGKLISEQVWNQQGELVGTGQCCDGEKWEGVFSSDSSDNDSNTITDLSIWANGVELVIISFDSAASSKKTQKLIAEVRASTVPQPLTESGTE